MFSFYENRRLLITGGSSGIGKTTAKIAASAGAHVHILGRNRARLEAAVAEIRSAASGAGRSIGGTVLDITDRAAISRSVPSILEALGGIDVVVNNAGIGMARPILDTEPELFEQMMATNFFGSVWVTRSFLPYLLHSTHGRIAFVSSLAGLLGVYGYGAYVPSKFAMTGFVEVLRQELLGSNVRVTIVFPPDVNTPMLTEELKDRPLGTKAVVGSVAALEPEVVARALLRAVANGSYESIVGAQSRITMWAARCFPWLARLIINHDLRRAAPPLPGQGVPDAGRPDRKSLGNGSRTS